MTISVNDTYVHRTAVEVLQKIFGYRDRAVPHGFRLPSNDKYVIWFPKLSVSSKQRPGFGWRNLLNADGTELVVDWVGDATQKGAAEKAACQYADRLQVVFGARLGYAGYEFLGVFKCKQGADGSWYQKDGRRHYERIYTSADVSAIR